MMSFGYIALKSERTAEVGFHAESSTVQPLKLKCSVSGMVRTLEIFVGESYGSEPLKLVRPEHTWP